MPPEFLPKSAVRQCSQSEKMKPSRSQTSPQRRAYNIIWTAAEDYSFEPPFVAFFQDGEPDFYMNSVIGYVHKWYDPAVISRLFDTLEGALFHETFDGLLWIALENCVYERESAERPVLRELRLSHAEQFFLQEQRLSRQQWMAQNSLVHALQAAKCREILGKNSGLVNPWERTLYSELQYNGEMNALEIEQTTLAILKKYFHFSSSAGKENSVRLFFQKLRLKLFRPLPFKVIRSENLMVGAPDTSLSTHHLTTNTSLSKHFQESQPRHGDALYIESCFGRSIFSQEENQQINLNLCQDTHQNCRLHFTDGILGPKVLEDPLVQKALEDAKRQGEKNRAFYQSNHQVYQRSILRLARQIQNAMLVHSLPLPVPNRSGQFHPSWVWRALTLNDTRVFLASVQEQQPDFSVDLLLDASASRLENQEMIATQAYILARGLQICGIPVQVCSFLSLRGFTVIRRFCSYQNVQKRQTQPSSETSRIFDYFAAGWNRDGLAFRGVGQLMESSHNKNRLLIILTDASPNDDRKIPSAPLHGQPISLDYSGKAGIQDALTEVRKLRQNHIQVMAILNGTEDDSEAARQIYGEDFIRIENLNQFSSAAGQLIQRQIEKARG